MPGPSDKAPQEHDPASASSESSPGSSGKKEPAGRKKGWIVRALDGLEWLGNKLPDPAILFLLGLIATWILSSVLSSFVFDETVPGATEPIQIVNLLTLEHFALFLSKMVEEFVSFHPLGVVLVALLGVGVAEASGFINAVLKSMLSFAPKMLLTPLLILVAIVSHSAADAGYVLVIPIGGVMFYAAGRHPLAGIAAAFAGVSGGFSANFIPSGIDPLLSGLTESGVSLIDPDRSVNPLCNIYFTAASSLLIILLGWFLTDRVIEPRLQGTTIDGDPAEMPVMEELSKRDQVAMIAALLSIALCGVLLFVWAWQPDSALRATDGSLTSMRPPAPLMMSIVPLIFLFFVVPGIVHGYVSGRFTSHRDVVKGMTRVMESMGYYLVLVFFAALFIAAFRDSNIGILLAVKGASFLEEAEFGASATIVGIILLTAIVNLLVGSASAKWAMLSPIFVPMLMLLGISPELTQCAYRVGDSTTNIITPMMPYFPLVVVFCQRYVKKTGIGTVAAMMLPYSVLFLVAWTIFLLIYWALGIPMGLAAPYTYSPPTAQ
jgi:aminobenzoyl-glutamate transport protein